jgi:predicted adenylyl cyclase CyaB
VSGGGFVNDGHGQDLVQSIALLADKPKRAMKNIEVKVRCPDLERAREIARQLGATEAGTLRQVDTYFHVPAGRLKLRQVEPGPGQLIFYHRPDQAGPKVSEYDVVPVAEPVRLRALLAAALGILVEVHKQRELWLLDNVRIHLDTVHGLGTFLEFEVVVDAAHPESTCWAQARQLMADFGLVVADLVAGSYADLLRASNVDEMLTQL